MLGSALSAETPAYDLQQACATGLETVLGLANKIKLGQIDSAIAGGVDSASDAPIAVSEGLREVLLDLNRAKTLPRNCRSSAGSVPRTSRPMRPNTGEPRTGLSMGEHQALTTAQWKITREAQDELAFNSHRNLAAAYDAGFFDDLLTPYRGLSRDSNLRADTSLEKLATLKPVFGKNLGAAATMTAGNSTPLTDGASTVLLASEEWADAHDLPKLAAVVDGEAAAVDFVHGKDGLLMAPAFAVPRLLARHGLTLADIDFFEIHEAFAGTVLSTLAAWEDEEFGRTRLGLDGAFGSIDRARLNVNGSSLAAGHPFAATGGRIVASLAKMLHAKGDGRRASGPRPRVRLRRRRPGRRRNPRSTLGRTMSDTYTRLVSNGLGQDIAKQLGLPQPVVLRRHEPGQPPHRRTGPGPGLRPGGADELAGTLLDWDLDVRRHAIPKERLRRDRPGAGRAGTTPADLAEPVLAAAAVAA